MAKRVRTPIPIPVQVEVLFRDNWLCYLCRRPLVFPFAMKQLEDLTRQEGIDPPPAYFNQQWRRDLSPLLDELACSIDHVEAFVAGGRHEIDNFAAVCARCNARKSARSRQEYEAAAAAWKVKGKHGEPTAWDGMAAVFVALAERSTRKLSPREAEWLQALKAHRASADRPPGPQSE